MIWDKIKAAVAELLDSPSKGKFLAHYIKPKYSDTKRRK